MSTLQSRFAKQTKTSSQNASSESDSSNAHFEVLFFTGNDHIKVVVHAMALLTTLLYDGNTEVQSLTFKYYNERTTKLFLTIDAILTTANSTLGLISKR